MKFHEFSNEEIQAGNIADSLVLKKLTESLSYLKSRINGGSGSPVWSDDVVNGAMVIEENGNTVAIFGQGLGQQLKMLYQVPSTYASGQKIELNLGMYNALADNTKSVSFAVKSSLNVGHLPVGDETHTQIFTKVFENSTTQNDIQNYVLNVTDDNGKINNESVLPNSFIEITLERKSDNVSEDVKFITALTRVEL